MHMTDQLSPLLFFLYFFVVYTHTRIRGSIEVQTPKSHQSPENLSKPIPPPPPRQNASRTARKPPKSPLCPPRRHALPLTHRCWLQRTATRLSSHASGLPAVREAWERSQEWPLAVVAAAAVSLTTTTC